MLKLLLVDAIDVDADEKVFETDSESLALPYLAAAVRGERDDVEIRIVDREVEAEIARFAPDVVGLSFVTINLPIAKRYARLARARGAKVVAGGPHVSAAPHVLPEEIDVGVVGDGEHPLLELLRVFPNRRWEDPAELEPIAGAVFRRDGAVVVNDARPPLDLDALPLPARDLKPHRRRGIITSRGCPYKCSFCFRAHLEQRVRYASPERVIREIHTLVNEYGVRHVRVYDDLFIQPPRRFRAIVDALVSDGITHHVSFNCNARPSGVTEEMARQLVRLNTSLVFLGIESAVQRVLSYLKPQHATVAQNERAIGILDAHGIVTTAGIIIGAPDETEEEIRATLAWLQRSRLDFMEVLLLTPLPGTAVWEDALERGIVSWDMDFRRLDLRADELQDAEPVIMSRTLTKERVIALYEEFLIERQQMRSRRARRVLWKTVGRLMRDPRRIFSKMLDRDSYANLARVLRA